MTKTTFEWDSVKEAQNDEKHGVSFSMAQYAFADPHRVIAKDESHSQYEERFYCFGKVDSGILTVRFTYRFSVIRIIGAGYWRKGKAIYERENQIYK
jgi:hypothetical protein